MMTNLSLTREQEQEQEEKNNKKKPLEEMEREHMFDKVVTPSDVGKLNRLVIPKQHAERYFPLDSSSNEKGLLLNFEDLSGKSWRFRYSYWNSSQSYVMTKGWSRFVKDKKLDAGDIVSFQRCVGDSGRESRLFIDWKRRPKVPEHHHHHHFASGAMFPRFYTSPTSYNLYNHQHPPPPRHLHGGYSYPQFPREFGYGYLVRSVDQRHNPIAAAAAADPLVIESVPVVMHEGGTRGNDQAVGKRLRLFGVDMECGESGVTNSAEEESSSSGGGGGGGGCSFSSLCQLRLGSSEDDHFTKKGKSSMSFDFDH